MFKYKAIASQLKIWYIYSQYLYSCYIKLCWVRLDVIEATMQQNLKYHNYPKSSLTQALSRVSARHTTANHKYKMTTPKFMMVLLILLFENGRLAGLACACLSCWCVQGDASWCESKRQQVSNSAHSMS